MYTIEELENLEQDELDEIEAAILIMLANLGVTKKTIQNEIRRFYQEYGTDGVVTYSEARKWVSNGDHTRRLTALLLFISDEFSTLNSTLATDCKVLFAELLNKEIEYFETEIDRDKPLETEWGNDEKTWDERLADDILLWSAYLAVDLKSAFVTSKPLNKVLEKVDKRFKTFENALNTLVTTEATTIGTLTRKNIFKELGFEKYKYYTMADERVCEICAPLHGMVFPLSAFEIGVTAPPLHPHCRDWIIPIK